MHERVQQFNVRDHGQMIMRMVYSMNDHKYFPMHILWDSIFHVDNQDYCAMPIAVSHILPSAKFVVVMRNPVERIFSHYVYFCTGKHSEPPPSNVFHESVVANVNFFRKCVSKCMNAPMTSNSLNHQFQLAEEQWDTISLLVCTTSTSRNGCSSIQEKAFCFSERMTCQVNLLAIFMEKYHRFSQYKPVTRRYC